MKGYFKRYLDVDLTTGKISDYNIPPEWYEKFVGGRGIAARIMLEEMDPGVDPLGPENLLIFSTGPFQGLNIPGAGRNLVMSKSPKTNTANGSYVGGFLGQELGSSGYDGIIIKGQASSPNYLVLKQGRARLKDGGKLWGKGTAETEKIIQKEEGDVKVASIGPAGENLVSFSCIIQDRNRAAGRPGLGSVMGSKKLKAVAVRGGKDKELAHEDKLKRLRADLARSFASTKAESWGKLGTTGGVMSLNELGILPTKNFQEGEFSQADRISGERMYDEILKKRDTCTGCPIRCKRVVETEYEGQKVRPEYGGPEYETIAALGSLCLNSNLDSIALANQKCNHLGLDTISTGVTIAFAMEASQKGLIDEDIGWGDSAKVVNLIEKIAYKKGIGKKLARGIDRLSEEIGADFAAVIKGQEVPMHEPRGKKALGISYASTPRGANHMEGIHDTMLESGQLAPEIGLEKHMDRFSYEGKVQATIILEDLRSFTNSLIMCALTVDSVGENYSFDQMREILKSVTGLETDPHSMLEIGERNYLLLKLFAGREGITKDQDKLPKRLRQPLPSGGSKGQDYPEEKLEELLEQYYSERGFDEFGPTDKKLREVNIKELQGLIERE